MGLPFRTLGLRLKWDIVFVHLLAGNGDLAVICYGMSSKTHIPQYPRTSADEALALAIAHGIGAESLAWLAKERANPFSKNGEGHDAFHLCLIHGENLCFEAILASGIADHSMEGLQSWAAEATELGMPWMAAAIEARMIAASLPRRGPAPQKSTPPRL